MTLFSVRFVVNVLNSSNSKSLQWKCLEYFFIWYSKMISNQERYENLLKDLNSLVEKILKSYELGSEHPFFSSLSHFTKERMYNSDCAVDFENEYSVLNFINQYISDVNLLLKKENLPFDLLIGDEANNFYYANVRTEKDSVLEVFDPKENFKLRDYEELVSPQTLTELYAIDLNNDNLLSVLNINLSLRGTHFYFEKLINTESLEQCSLADTYNNKKYLVECCVNRFSELYDRNTAHVSADVEKYLVDLIKNVSNECHTADCFSLVKDTKKDLFLFFPLYKYSENNNLAVDLSNDESLHLCVFSRLILDNHFFDEIKKVTNDVLCNKYERAVLADVIEDHEKIMSNESSKERFVYQHKDLELFDKKLYM